MRQLRKRPPHPPAERDGQAEQRILDSAHIVFLRRGTAGARMQDIAADGSGRYTLSVLEELNRTLVFLSRAPAFECAEVSSSASLGMPVLGLILRE